jgi:lipopolysaccharide transport system permease protein
VFVQIRAVYRARDLLWSWTVRGIRARYEQSALGWLWAIVQPVAQVLIFTVIFTYFVPVDTGNIPYPIFSYVAIVPWTLLATSLPDMSQALVGNLNLITKIYFPREILPIAALLARLMDFGIAVGLFVVLMLIYKLPFFAPGLVYLPLILAVQLLLLLGLGLVSSAANVFFRDVQSLLTLGIQLWFYATPIIYPVSAVPERLRQLYFLNPMTGVIQGYRDVLLNRSAPGESLLVSFLVSLLIFVFGYWFFRRVEFLFADIV